MFYIIYGGDNFASGGTVLEGGGNLPGPANSGQQKNSPQPVKSLPANLATPTNVVRTSMNQYTGVYPGWVLNNGLCMEVMHFDNVEREFVLSADHTTYHYTRWTISASVYINPELNGVSLNRQLTDFPSIVESDISIRNFLKQPRRRLTILWNSAMETTSDANTAYQVLLDCPTWGYTIDNEEGPTPHSYSIKSIMGSAGYVGQFTITCATDDSQSGAMNLSQNQSGRSVPLLLSNRWKMVHSHQNGYLTRVIEGTATANVPELKRRNLVIDQIRSMIFPPLYPGMKRNYESNVSPEGSVLMYTITDTQEAMTYVDQYLPLPSEIKSQVAAANNDDAFSGVYFESSSDLPKLRTYLKQQYPISTATPQPLPFSFTDQGPGLNTFWFGTTFKSRREIESLEVVHEMKVIRDGSEADLIYEGVQAGSNAMGSFLRDEFDRQQDEQDYKRQKRNYNRNKKGGFATPPRPLKSRGKFRTLQLLNTASAAGNGIGIARAIDALIPKFIETVNVVAVCKPEGNMKRAFFLALSTAYGLANNKEKVGADPYSIIANFNYHAKTVQVQISYSAVDFTQANRRGTGLAKIMVGPQSYLIGGPMDRNVRGEIALNEGDVAQIAALNNILAQNFLFIDTFQAGLGAPIYPFSANANQVLSVLAENDLPDKDCLIMLDQSLFGQTFPTFGPNGDQISRAFIECFIPLFSAPLVSAGEYPVMLGRAVYPQNAPASSATSSNLSNFYNRSNAFLGDSQSEMVNRVDVVDQLTWQNKPF